MSGLVNGSTYAWIDATAFPLAGGAGISGSKFGPTKYEACGVTNKPVKLKNGQAHIVVITPANPQANPPTPAVTTTVIGEGSVNVATFTADCHEAKKLTVPTQVISGPKESGGEMKSAQPTGALVDDDLPAVSFQVTVNREGANHVFCYTVTNNYVVPISFSWPAVRTPDHMIGWSGTVSAGSSLQYNHTTTEDVVEVHGSPGAVTVTDQFNATVVVGRLVAPALCPVGSVSIPAPISGLSAVNGQATVALSWTMLVGFVTEAA